MKRLMLVYTDDEGPVRADVSCEVVNFPDELRLAALAKRLHPALNVFVTLEYERAAELKPTDPTPASK